MSVVATRDRRGTWSQAIKSFFAPVLIIFAIRWLIFEPFMIPSGSMIPTLLVHDHIFVNKLSYGIKVPLGRDFLWQWDHPKKGQVVVFRYPENPEVFYVKRVLATAGDEISIEKGVVKINGEALPLEPAPEPSFLSAESEHFEYFFETSSRPYLVRYQDREESYFPPTRVPENSFFAMGDNRSQSNDSRFWGFVPEANLIGAARRVWLSCRQTLVSAQFLCDPQTIRWNRLLQKVD